MIKAIFFDIDGTLCDFQTHLPSRSTVDALWELKRKGIKLFVATGRHTGIPEQNKILYDLPPVFAAYIGLNGAVCADPNFNIISRKSFNSETARSIISTSESNSVFMTIYQSDRIVAKRVDREMAEALKQYGMSAEQVTDDMIDYNDILMFSFWAPVSDELTKGLKDCELLTWCNSGSDIVQQGMGKHMGIQMMMEHYGFAREETMAFGDETNDVTMVKFAGIGVAMGNAMDSVKAAADYITDTDVNDGISKALKHFGLID